MRLINRIIVLLVAIVTIPSTAQELSLHAGGLFGFSSSKSFNEYRDYYNEINSGVIDKELNKGTINYGTNLQLNFALNKLYTSIGFSNVFNLSSATFPNGSSREILFNSRYYNILIGYKTFNEANTSELAIYTGFSGTDYIMSSFIVYPNGDKDYLKNELSGIHQTQGTGVPLLVHYAHSIGFSNIWIYGKCQIQAINATKFGVFDYQGLEKQIKDDAKRMLFEIGLEYKFK